MKEKEPNNKAIHTEEDIPSPFDNQDIAVIVKKARRKTLLRNILISAIVSPVVLFFLYIGILQINYYKKDMMDRDLLTFKQITDPNVHSDIRPYLYRHGLFNGEVHYHTYKIIEGRPVRAEEEVYEYGVLGGFSRIDRYAEEFFELEEASESPDGSRHYYSYETMQRQMQFYHPGTQYRGYLNDFPLLAKYKGKVAELAVSFDRPYTVAEIKAMLPKEARPVWYRVQTSDAEKPQEKNDSPQPELADRVYGFDATPGNIAHGNGTEKDFLLALDAGLKIKGRYYDEYKRIYDYISHGKEKPTPADVKIIGVVVTGTTEGLLSLKGKPYVKAAVLGAMTDQ